MRDSQYLRNTAGSIVSVEPVDLIPIPDNRAALAQLSFKKYLVLGTEKRLVITGYKEAKATVYGTVSLMRQKNLNGITNTSTPAVSLVY